MRAYLAALAAGLLATLLAIGAANWLVDPYGIYASPRIEGFNRLKPGLKGHIRMVKTIVVARERWEALIIGTSRAEIGFDPRHALFGDRRCYNAAMGGQSMAEGVRLVEAALARGTLKQVVALVDDPVFNADYASPPDYDDANYRPWRAAALAFNAGTLLESALTPFHQDRRELFARNALWTGDGRFEYPPPPSGHRDITLKSEDTYLRIDYFPAPRYAYRLPAAGSGPLEDYRRLLALAHARGIELTLVIAPAHARQWETLAAAGLWDTWEDWKRRLVALNAEEARKAGRPAFALWDFSGYSTLTTEPFPAPGDRDTRMAWYWESSHFTKAAGDLALERVRGAPSPPDLGVALAPDNVEAHLAAIRAARLRWRASHPSDVAEIAALEAAAARWRAQRRSAR